MLLLAHERDGGHVGATHEGQRLRVRLQDRRGSLDDVLAEARGEVEPLPWASRAARDTAARAATVAVMESADRALVTTHLRKARFAQTNRLVVVTLARGREEDHDASGFLVAKWQDGLATWPYLDEIYRDDRIEEATEWLERGYGRMPFTTAKERDEWVVGMREAGCDKLADILAVQPFFQRTPDRPNWFHDVHLPDWAWRFTEPAQWKSARGGRGSAKALRFDTPIATPDGWTEIGELKPGDKVFGTDGTPVTVTGVHPQGKRRMWAVRMRYGETIYADADHLWRMTDHAWRKRRNRRGLDYHGWNHEIRSMTTEGLADHVRYGKRQDLNLSIPVAKALVLPEAELPIPPYALGLWLGDGDTNAASMTAAPEDAEFYAGRLAGGGEVTRLRPSRTRPGGEGRTGSVSFALTPGKAGLKHDPSSFRDRLRRLGVLGEKQIPDSYLRGSVTQRADLLAGLMDTDGSISADGREASYVSTKRQLAEGVLELVHSLGARAVLAERVGRYAGEPYPYFRVTFRPFPGCVSLPRKVRRMAPPTSQRNRTLHRMIEAIEQTDEEAEAVCITVDAPDHMFLAGRSMVPTHNSHSVAQIMILRMTNDLPAYEPGPVRIVSARDYNTTLSTSVKVAVENYIKELGFEDEFDPKANEIRHRNGSLMIFQGVEANPDAFLSMEGIDIFWMEQAECLTVDHMVKIAPTIRKRGSELLFVWNPHRRMDWCWQRFSANPQGNEISISANFHDNPFWSKELDTTRLYDEETEPNLYDWIYLGEPHDGDAEHQILPYGILEKCVEAYRRGLAPEPDGTMPIDFGFDIGEGGRDKCSTVGRVGPCVEHLDTWPGLAGDLDPAAERAHANTDGFEMWRMYYDASAAMRGPLIRAGALDSYGVRPVGFGGEVMGKTVLFEARRTNQETFTSRNIQMAMALRLRANRTVALLNGRDVDPADCLFINPQLPRLKQFLDILTKPIRRLNPTTAKWELDKRGGDANAKSPDEFDGLCLAFCRDSEYGLRARF